MGRRIRRRFALALFPVAGLLAGIAFADDPIFLSDGLSPDGKLSVVIAENNNWYESGPDWPTPRDGQLDLSKSYLYDADRRKIIGPFDEFNTTGGGFGMSAKNVSPKWSSDSKFLAISYRCGRLNYDYALYKIALSHNGWRAIPQKLPKEDSGPNGAKIFSGLSSRANAGQAVEKWLGPNSFEVIRYGYFTPGPTAAGSAYFNGDGEIGVVYIFSEGHWRIKGYQTPGIMGTSDRPLRIVASSRDGKLEAIFEWSKVGDEGATCMTLVSYAGKIQYRCNDIFPESVESAEWDKDGNSITITLDSGSVRVFSLAKLAVIHTEN